MASEIQNGKKEFSFIWRIENISYSWHKTGDKIISPAFVVESFEETCWTLRLHPRGRKNEDYMSFYLYREKEDNGPLKISLNYELSFLDPDGSPVNKDNLKIKGSFARNMSYGHPRSVSRDEIFGGKKHLYVDDDSIVAYCKMWKGEGSVCNAQKAFARSRIGVEKASIAHHFKSNIIQFIPIFKGQKVITLKLSHDKGKICIEMAAMEKSIKYTSCKLSILDSIGQVVRENHLSWFDEDIKDIWQCPLSLQEYEQKGDKLSFLGEFSFSSTMDYEKIEKVEYGTQLLAPILRNISNGKSASGSNVANDLKSLFDKQILFDAKIRTATKLFPVHRILLCARSTKFRMIFKNYSKDKTVGNEIEMLDLEDGTVKRLLFFLYTDTLGDLQWDIAAKLYYASSEYQFLKLKALCTSYLIDKLNASNASQLLLMADTHRDSILKKIAEDFILKNDQQIFASKEWDTFTDAQPQLAAKTMGLKYKQNKESKKIDLISLPKMAYDSIVDDLKFLYTSQLLNDVELKTKKTTFPAHITVLCARSTVFREIFQSSQKEYIDVEDFEDDIVRRLLLFMYTDVVENLQWKIATKLYYAAVKFKVEGLKMTCSSYFVDNLSMNNATEVLVLADQLRDLDLKAKIEKFILRNEREIYGSDGWATFAERNPNLAVDAMLIKYRKK